MGAVKAGVGGVVEFRVLGPVEVTVNGDPVQLGGAKARAVLAVLLLAGGRVVPVEKLIHLVWPEGPPASAPVLIRVYVSSLRKRLAESGHEQEVIQTRPPGYVADLGTAELDSRNFADLVAEARRCHSVGDLTGAADAYGRALALWRGTALDGVGDVLRTEADRLEELRLSVLEERISVDLALGRESELVAEVRALWAAHPMRERLLGYLMTVLYRLGRQAEALEAFAEGRRILAEELGIDPGPELRALHQAVLRADQDVLGGPAKPAPNSDEPGSPTDGTSEQPAPVAQLPPAVADFTGRSSEVAGLLAGMRAAGTAVPVCVIAGQGGSGKSALAVNVAHRLTDDFPDGQVYVELRGMGDASAAPEDVLRRLLRDFGAGALSQPTGLEELSARYRSVLAGRRVLVVLDDAADERQVRSLLPGTPGSAVLVTSRNRLAGLAGANLTELGVLTAQEGVDLLARIVGGARVAHEPEAAQRIAALCGHLPLAIRIAGARLASRPDWSLARLAHRLSDELRRLDELAVGDQEVRAGIELSYRGLPGSAKRALRLLGVLGPPTFCATTLAVLLGSSLPDAEDSIESLIDAQLVQSAGRDGLGRMIYRVHDLVGVFGRERAEAEDSRTERMAAVRRVLGGWLWLIEQISRDAPSGLISSRDTYRLSVPFDPALAEPFLADPMAWFEAEQDVFVAGVERAAALDLADLAGELTSALAGSLFVMFNRLQAWSRTLAVAIAAARRAGDTHGEARLMAELGELKLEEDKFVEAREYLLQALAMFREIGDRQGELSALASLGAASREVGAFAEALGFLADAYHTAVVLGDDAGIGLVTRLRGSVWLELGDFDRAMPDLELSLAAYRRASSRRGEALTLRTTSMVHRARGELDIAEAQVWQSLTIFRAVRDELLTAFSVQAWAKTRIRQGKPEGLVEDLRAALAVSRRHGDRFGAALSLRTLGELYLSVGRLAQARGSFAESVAIWDELDLPLFRARTMRDIARLLDASGDPAAAGSVRSQALEIFRRYGSREADEVSAEAHCDTGTPAQV